MDIRIEEIESRPVAGIRVETGIAEIGNKVGELMGELMPAVGEHMNGAPLAIYHTWENDRGEMEVAVPVNPSAPATDRIVRHDLPSGKAVVATYVGPYDGLKESWEAVGAWMKERGLEQRAAPWEQYESDCTVTPPEKLVTRIIWPIND